jgi:CBS domain-containing protein
MTSILVKDYMQHNAHAIPSSANVEHVVEHLLNHNITGAPVIDESRQVVGFVSEQDCIKEMLNSAFFCAEPPPVTSIMRKDVLTVTPETSILEIAETMLLNKPKNYPVVSNGKLVGLINRRHILQALMHNEDSRYAAHKARIL